METNSILNYKNFTAKFCFLPPPAHLHKNHPGAALYRTVSTYHTLGVEIQHGDW